MSKKTNSKFFLEQADTAIKRMRVLVEKRWLTPEEHEEFRQLDKSSDIYVARAMKEFELEQKRRVRLGIIFFSLYAVVLLTLTIITKILK